jgi:3-methyladenine DNA glycosylase AlkD
MSYFRKISVELNNLASPKKALILQRFFKTGPGEYGEGDIFLGIQVPDSRKIAVKYKLAPLTDVAQLLKNKIHEYRLVGFLILVSKYESTKIEEERKLIFDFYFQNAKAANNWDLVDLSAPKIIGNFLFNHSSLQKREKLLIKLAMSDNIWERRIAIVSTFYFIRQGSFRETFLISKILLNDSHDLIHKAVGWMLREAGKRISRDELLKFLDANLKNMPRTALRYAIEHLPEKQRKAYLYCRF